MQALAFAVDLKTDTLNVQISVMPNNYMANAVSISRVTGRKHFPTDALKRSVFGYLIDGYVVRRRSAQYTSLTFFVPVMDQTTLTYGTRVEFSPDKISPF
jgi:hypothetical protein